MQKAISDFEVSGVLPVNPEKFTEIEF